MNDSGITAATEAATILTKPDAGQEATPSSLESSPERDAEATQDPAQPQKRKGGRKPIYATSEERKQRNRQAQAAFRERRTEYIKQLETTIKHHEETLQNLQQSHRSAADECLMLRYKNSLLERILLEKGIDVQAELQMKTGSPALGPSYVPQTAPGPMGSAPLQRTALNRQHARRAGQPFAQRIPGSASQSEMSFNARSPQGHPTPSSHASSPTALSTQSPASMQQGGMTPPTTVMQGQHQQYIAPQPPRQRYVMQHPPHRPIAPSQFPSSGAGSSISAGSVGDNNAGTPATSSTYFQSPFQKQIDQLDQEYDAPTNPMLESDNDMTDQPTTQGIAQRHYPTAPFQPQMPQNGLPHTALPTVQQMHARGGSFDHDRSHPTETGPQGASQNQVFDPYDPILDADPFGLNASMHFPTNYSYDQAPQR